MRIRFIDKPVYRPREEYYKTLDHIKSVGSKLKGIQCIYQFGTVSAPGISDLDLIFVFKEGANNDFSILQDLPDKHRYFLTHNVVGITESQLKEGFRYSFWHNINHLWGPEIEFPTPELTDAETVSLKQQIALEYLVTFNLSFTTQFTYGIFKLRSVLQQIKGLRYDLEFLGITNGRLYEMLNECYDWINDWFETGPSEKHFAQWLIEFNDVYQKFTIEQLNQHNVYSRDWENIRSSRHIELLESDKYAIDHKGLVLPHLIDVNGKKYFNLLHRFNSFKHHLPVVKTASHSILEERVGYYESLFQYNQKHLPRFEAMITPFVAFQLVAKRA